MTRSGADLPLPKPLAQGELVQAERHLIDSGMRREKRKEVRDSLSAVFMLQSALDARNRK